MKVKELKISKAFKFGLPNYSNVSGAVEMSVEVNEDELVNGLPKHEITDRIWQMVDKELYKQTRLMKPEWVTNREFSKFFESPYIKETIQVTDIPF